MKKIILSSIVAASLAVSGFAEDEIQSSSKSGFYVGVGHNSFTGTHTIPYDIDMTSTYESYGYDDTSSEDKSDDVDADGSTIKIGWDKKSYRFELSYSSLKSKGDGEFFKSISTSGINKTSQTFDEKFTGFDFDFIKPFTNNNLKPYLAAGLGYYAWDDYTVTSSSGSSTRDRMALAYNLGAGVLYSLGTVEFDIAYKWKKLNWEDVTSDLTNSSGQKGGERTRTDEETTVSGLYVGVNIHF